MTPVMFNLTAVSLRMTCVILDLTAVSLNMTLSHP
jgi:hypothetical protein